ncbi:fimbrial chaperone [Salmonella enterica]|nr:fimbrial chaperone [Salmonella enterica subsp. enterica serovar Nottingham]EGF0806128.1 fimbrial chaperone [Salmonella enterica]EGF6457294.1 fimbrial chaperone [Salmonella enterica]EGH3351776.1 fimbrial chaperone [Salmonella enterica]EGY8961652.1 fimbrial chaperone [Salmonella enterica]
MNKNLIAGAAFILNIVVAFQASAAFTLSGTRFIYDEGRKNISVEVSNANKETFGGQVWVDNTTQPSGEVFFTPAPSFFKVAGGEKQIIRLLNVNPALPQDRESLFWLNVQEIPPAPKDGENVLAIALNTQVKLFYRPKHLKDGRDKAEQKMQVNGTKLKNPTPYYFAVTAVTVNGQKIKLSSELDKQLSQMSPFTEVNVGRSLTGTVVIEAIDDYGARREYTLG